jgi:hypothetical protein
MEKPEAPTRSDILKLALDAANRTKQPNARADVLADIATMMAQMGESIRILDGIKAQVGK